MRHVLRHASELLSLFVVLAVILGSSLLTITGRTPCVSVGVWVLAIVGWTLLVTLRDRELPWRFIPLLPNLFVGQYYVDKLVPMLGSASILMVHVAGIIEELRAPRVPAVRLVKRYDYRDESVVRSRGAARRF